MNDKLKASEGTNQSQRMRSEIKKYIYHDLRYQLWLLIIKNYIIKGDRHSYIHMILRLNS